MEGIRSDSSAMLGDLQIKPASKRREQVVHLYPDELNLNDSDCHVTVYQSGRCASATTLVECKED